jgi:hypothetical protein
VEIKATNTLAAESKKSIFTQMVSVTIEITDLLYQNYVYRWFDMNYPLSIKKTKKLPGGIPPSGKQGDLLPAPHACRSYFPPDPKILLTGNR